MTNLAPAAGFTLKKGIKESLAAAFQASFSSDFWSSLSPQMGKVVPSAVVLQEYPTEAFNKFPFVKLSVDIHSAVWTSINSNQNTGLVRTITGEGTCTVDLWSLSAPMRDDLFDALVVLLVLRENTGADIFDEVLDEAWAGNGYPRITPKYGSVNLGLDDDGTGLPWAPKIQLYTSSLSFDFGYLQSFAGVNEGEKVTKVTAQPKLEA